MNTEILFFVFGYLRTHVNGLEIVPNITYWCSESSLSFEALPCIKHFADYVASSIPTWTPQMTDTGAKL